MNIFELCSTVWNCCWSVGVDVVAGDSLMHLISTVKAFFINLVIILRFFFLTNYLDFHTLRSTCSISNFMRYWTSRFAVEISLETENWWSDDFLTPFSLIYFMCISFFCACVPIFFCVCMTGSLEYGDFVAMGHMSLALWVC